MVVSGTNNSAAGVNLYTGGTLSVATLTNLGASGTTVNFFGGTLATTGSFTETYPLVFNVPGGTLNVGAGTTLTLSATVTGSASAPLTKTGLGTLNVISAAAHTAPIDLKQGNAEIVGQWIAGLFVDHRRAAADAATGQYVDEYRAIAVDGGSGSVGWDV